MEKMASLPELKVRLIDRVAEVLKTMPCHIKGIVRRISLRTLAFVLCPCVVLAAVTVSLANLKHVKITENGNSRLVSTFASDPAEILEGSGVRVGSYDKIVFSGFSKNYGTINYYPAFKVSVAADGRTTGVMMTGGTVGEAIRRANVTVGADDIVSNPLDMILKSAADISVKRVTFATKTQLRPVSYETVTQPTALLKKGVKQVVAEGKPGESTVTSKIKYIDGDAADEQIISMSTTLNPTAKIVLAGAAASTPVSKIGPSNITLDSNGVPTSYSRCISGVATAYTTSGVNITDSGRRAGVGYVAVNPKKIPYGTKLYIMSPDGSFVYGYAVAADTGGFVTNGSGVTTDLYFPSQSACDSFGVRDVNIYVLK